MENENIIREKKIFGILEQEIKEGEDLAAEARRMVEYLLLEKKGYAPADIQKSVVFEVSMGGEKVHSGVDFMIILSGRKAMVIKCAAGSLSSRERQAVAAARVISSPPVPIAVVADPVGAEVIDTASGKVIGEGFGAIPVREQMVKILDQYDPQPLSPERIEKEKRILLAFDAIRCCVPKGADGGVRLNEKGK